MKKFLTLTIIALIALVGLTVSVSAANVLDEATIKAALTGTDAIITLTSDITLTTPLEVEREVTIDLNGHSITPASDFDIANYDYVIAVLRQGDLTVKDSASNGKVSNAGMKLVIVKMTIFGEGENGDAAEFTLESGILEDTFTGEKGYAVISGNGNRHNTVITINGGTVKSNSSHAIYHPQEGKVTVNGGKIEGITGIEMRSGTLQVNNGTIIGTGVPSSSEANGSGSTTIGAGIAIAQHTTERNISVAIEGGNIEGYSAIYESNPNEATEKVSLEISGGEFEAINGGTEAVYSENKTGFITGGTFSSDVSSYVDASLEAVEDEETGIVYVGTLHTITIADTENGEVTADKTEAVKGQTIKLTITPDEGYEVDTISLDFGGYGKGIEGNEFTMIDSDVEIIVTFKAIEDEEVEEDESTTGEGTTAQKPEEDKKDETPKTGSVDVVLFASVIVAVISVAGIVTVKKYTR